MTDSDPVWDITIAPAGLRFCARASEDLLTAARRAGVTLSWACRNGVCELCEATLSTGRVHNTRTQQNEIPTARIMLCRSQPCGPVTLEINAVMAAGNYPPKMVQASVHDITPLSHDVFRVLLDLPKRQSLQFHAGQYLAVHLSDAEPSYFSIASSPNAQQIELHVQAATDWTSAQRIMETLEQHGQVSLELPHGKACLGVVPQRPLVLVAAGTGFAQVKSLVDYLMENDCQQPVTLYWGVRRSEDMYLGDMARQWHEQHSDFTFIPVVGDSADNDWSGHHDQLVHTVLAGRDDWASVDVLASGSPVMVYTLMDALLEAGMPPERFASDVLEYAPR